MKNFLSPGTIAIIGASNNEEKVGYSLMKNLENFKGNVIPINIHEYEILGKKAYKSIKDYKGKIDLSIIAIPAKAVKKVLEECGKKKIKNIIVISAGFSEIGKNKEEEELVKIAKKYKIKLLGPNSFGVVNPYLDLDTTFSVTSPEKGNIAFISQSGALWSAVSDYSIGKFGFSGFVSLGNMANVGFNEFIEYFDKDKNTKVIVLYIERLKDGRKFIDICKKSKKPIIVIKSGVYEKGREAVISHTGSLASEHEIYKAAFKQANVRLVGSLTSAFDIAGFNVPKIKKVIIVTNAGGLGSLTADYCEEKGIEVAELPRSFVKKLKLSDAWSRSNPIDLVGDAMSEDYREVFENLKKEKFYDGVVVLLTPQKMTDVEKIAEEIVKFKKESNKVVVSCFSGGLSVRNGKNLLEKEGVPCFFDAKRVVDIIS